MIPVRTRPIVHLRTWYAPRGLLSSKICQKSHHYGVEIGRYISRLVLCQITRQARSDGYAVPLVLTDFERGRLAVDSFIRANRLFTVEQSVIL